MKNLHHLKNALPPNAHLSEEELAILKGGRRYVTSSYIKAMAVYDSLCYMGYNCTMSSAEGNYCIDW